MGITMLNRPELTKLEGGLDVKIKERVIKHRNNFYKLFRGRYHELLPSLIKYSNEEKTSIDFLKLEVLLLNNYDVVIGKARNGKVMILGFSNSRQTIEDPASMFISNKLTKRDITFVIEKDLIPRKMSEISNLDNCTTGNFIIVRNKTLNYTSDSDIIKHYTNELAELVLSRYSLVMQSKLITMIHGDENDTDIEQLVSDLYNGSPYVKVGTNFDPEEQIYTFQNGNIASNFAELKREYQNKISELNNMLGINSLAVDKESGVSNMEAESNKPYVSSVAQIKLSSREQALEKLNKRYNYNIEVMYNDEVASEFMELSKEEEEDNG